MKIDEASPLSMVIVEDRSGDSVRFAEVTVLGACVAETPILVSSTRTSQPQDVVHSFYAECEEDDAKERPRADASLLPPRRKHPILIRLVAQELRPNTVLAGGIQGLCRIVYLAEYVEAASALLELEVTVGLLAVFPDFQFQLLVAVDLADADMTAVRGGQRMHHDVRRCHRMAKQRWSDRRGQGSWNGCIGMEHAITICGEAVVVHEAASADGSREGRD